MSNRAEWFIGKRERSDWNAEHLNRASESEAAYYAQRQANYEAALRRVRPEFFDDNERLDTYFDVVREEAG